MTARLSKHTDGESDRPMITSAEDSSLSADRGRVVSVSARQTDRDPVNGTNRSNPSNGTAMPAKSVFLTPRVIDQEAFDELSRSLHALIEGAAERSSALANSVSKADRTREQVTRTNMNLQERLRLSARMLKAFQSQIVRVESAIADAESQCRRSEDVRSELVRARDQLNEERDRSVAAARQEIEDVARETIARLDEGIAVRLERLEELDARIRTFEERAASVEHACTSAEATASSVVQRTQELCSQIEAHHHEAANVIEQCDQAKRSLGECMVEVSQVTDHIEHRCNSMSEAVRQQDERLADVHPRIRQATDELTNLSDRFAGIEQLRSDLNTMLERLGPWEQLLHQPRDAREHDRENVDLPEPLMQVIETVRMRVDENLAAFSAALRDMADGFSRLSAEPAERSVATEVGCGEKQRNPERPD